MQSVQCVLNMELATQNALICSGGIVIQRVNPSVRPAFSPLNLSYNPATVQPGLSGSPAKARQRGRAAKHGTQWHILCGFLGTAWRTVALLCQASLYCLEPPLAVAHQATREAEKVFHWALIEKTPPWIQQMPVSCIDAQLLQSCWQLQRLRQGLSRGTEPDHRSDRLVCASSGGCRANMQGRCTRGWGDKLAQSRFWSKGWRIESMHNLAGKLLENVFCHRPLFYSGALSNPATIQKRNRQQ